MGIDWDKFDRVVVIGLAATGKSWLVDNVLPPGYKVFHTDDYITDDFENDLYTLMDAIRRHKGSRVCVEGIQGYRLLRKLAQRKMKQPDLVIKCVTPLDIRRARYKERGKKFPSGQDAMLTKVWMDYINEIRDQKSPVCVMYDTLTESVVGDRIL